MLFRSFADWSATVALYVNCVYMTDRTTSGSNVVDFGPRPWYLADRLTDETTYLPATSFASQQGQAYQDRTAKLEHLKAAMSWDSCPGPYTRDEKSMSMGGAAMEFPRHTREAYLAAARMGAGALGCQAVFTKDGDLVCRSKACDLHLTTDLLLNPALVNMTKQCSEPFTPGQGAKCCVSDFTTSEFKQLCGVTRMEAQIGRAHV